MGNIFNRFMIESPADKDIYKVRKKCKLFNIPFLWTVAHFYKLDDAFTYIRNHTLNN